MRAREREQGARGGGRSGRYVVSRLDAEVMDNVERLSSKVFGHAKDEVNHLDPDPPRP